MSGGQNTRKERNLQKEKEYFNTRDPTSPVNDDGISAADLFS
jgi:hypothetical protein